MPDTGDDAQGCDKRTRTVPVSGEIFNNGFNTQGSLFSRIESPTTSHQKYSLRSQRTRSRYDKNRAENSSLAGQTKTALQV